MSKNVFMSERAKSVIYSNKNYNNKKALKLNLHINVFAIFF